MAKVGKKYAEAVKLIEADKFYEPVEGIELVKKTANCKIRRKQSKSLSI